MTSYLITGANRGIGRGLVEALAKRPNTTVVAAVRNPETAKDLEALSTGSSKVIVVKISSTSETDAKEAVELLKTKHGLTKLDVVVANAGIASSFGKLVDLPLSIVREHWEVNALGPLILFQAIFPLLEKSSDPKFIAVSTAVASIGGMENLPVPFAGYGQSKAALNYITRKLHFEHENMTIFPISPGWVATEMYVPFHLNMAVIPLVDTYMSGAMRAQMLLEWRPHPSRSRTA